jgi:hypothetical protein
MSKIESIAPCITVSSGLNSGWIHIDIFGQKMTRTTITTEAFSRMERRMESELR